MSTITLKAILLAIIFIFREIRKGPGAQSAAVSEYNHHAWALDDIYRDHFKSNP